MATMEGWHWLTTYQFILGRWWECEDYQVDLVVDKGRKGVLNLGRFWGLSNEALEDIIGSELQLKSG
jgi:hypothetical protein